jgi:predicted ester cyclase
MVLTQIRSGKDKLMSEENKAIYRRMSEEVWNQGHLDRAGEFFASDVVIHSAQPGTPPGIAGVTATVSMMRSAFPDLKISNESIMAEGDLLTARWIARGTHRGELLGTPPTGKRVEFGGISIVRMSGGKIAEIWGESDQLGLMQQIGAVPAMAPA